MPWNPLSIPPDGPQAYSHDERMRRAEEIAARFSRLFRDRLQASALYGSLARGSDGPFSDIEMMIVIRGSGIEENYEWSSGPWKAEVNIYSEDKLLAWAAEFDEFWPITHGAIINAVPMQDTISLFPHARAAVMNHSDDEFRKLIGELLVGDLYEDIGKVRNGLALQRTEIIAPFTVDAARYGACLVGLHNRRVYISGVTLFSESLELPGRPDGYDALARLVMTGELNDAAHVTGAVNAFWSGVETWAAAQHIPLTHDLEDLLAE